MFLKQIRPSGIEALDPDQQSKEARKAHFADLFNGYLVWMMALFLPGLHQWYFGNTPRAIKYLFTVNEVLVGWGLDLIDIHIFVQQRVEQYGNSEGIFFGLFQCGWPCWSIFGCDAKSRNVNQSSSSFSQSTMSVGALNAEDKQGPMSSVDRGF